MESQKQRDVEGHVQRTYYECWRERQDLPVYEGVTIERLDQLKLSPWAPVGVKAAFVDLKGSDEHADMMVWGLEPGEQAAQQHHLYEALVFVLSGNGVLTIGATPDGRRHSVEWTKGSLFAVPPNAYYSLFNLGKETAKLCMLRTAPVVLSLFHDEGFVYGDPYVFSLRVDMEDPKAYSGETVAKSGRILETNFVDDVLRLELSAWPERGRASSNAMLDISSGTLTAHVSSFPVGMYKKAHRHGPGAHVIVLSGKGYSLMWPEGGKKIRCDWEPGTLVVPPGGWFHQHFNTGKESANYLALRWGSPRYPFSREVFRFASSVKEGGDQIEYEDEDIEIRELFESELSACGLVSQMGMGGEN